MRSSELAGLEMIACIALVAALNKRLADANMDGKSHAAMYAGAFFGLVTDLLLLNESSKRHPNSPIKDYVTVDDTVAGLFFVIFCMLASQAVRHAAPVIFSKIRGNDPLIAAPEVDAEAQLIGNGVSHIGERTVTRRRTLSNVEM